MGCEPWSLTTLREKLIKFGAKVVTHDVVETGDQSVLISREPAGRAGFTRDFGCKSALTPQLSRWFCNETLNPWLNGALSRHMRTAIWLKVVIWEIPVTFNFDRAQLVSL